MIHIILAILTACSPLNSTENSASHNQEAIDPTPPIATQPYVEPDFSKWDVPLQNLGVTAKKYENREKARELVHTIRDKIKKNPDVQEKQVIHYRTYEYNRSGRDLPGPELCANDLCIDNQCFILAGLPKNIESAAQYWNVILQQEGCLVVSLHDSTESEDLCNNFWKQQRLSQMQLVDGWTITEQNHEILIKGKKSKKGTFPALIKTTLLATNSEETRTLFHLHYVGWPNHTSIPDKTVFQALLKNMRLLSPKKILPIAINCHGGIGRTGATAATYILERQISKAVRENKENEYRVNLAKIIYDFRKQRPNVLSNSNNISKIFSVLERHYNGLKRNESRSFPVTP